MKTEMLQLLQNLDCGKREMLRKYLGARKVIKTKFDELSEEHAAFICGHLPDVLFRAEAFFDPDEAFYLLSLEVCG